MRTRTLWVTAPLVLAAAAVVRADDPPDSQLNPQTQVIETVSSEWSGTDLDGRFTIDPGNGQPTVSFVFASDPADDHAPRLAISPAGDTWITWWRDSNVDEVRVRRFHLDTQTWGEEILVGESTEAGRNPEIVVDGADAWIVYEIAGATSTSLAVGVIADEPDPISTRTIVATTSYAADLDVQIHAESGHLWVTWIDSDSHVGWAEYTHSSLSWSSPEVQTYSGSAVSASRDAIRSAVLAN